MPSDPQNKAERPDRNIVALHRAEFVASIEKKLSDARRFFSLHDFASCEQLVQEVLAADPQNSKAKALLDLSSIKLSKRKLYKKIAEAQPLPSSGSALADTPPAGSLNDPSQPASEVSRIQPGPLTTPPESSSENSPPRRRRGLPQPGADSPQDSMRERTISALVDLLKNKEITVQDWRGNSHDRTASHPNQSPPPQPSPTVSEPPAPVLEPNHDFLPSSLDELFEAGLAKPVTPPQLQAPLSVAPATRSPEEHLTPPAVPSPPLKKPHEATEARQTAPQVPPIEASKRPEKSLSPPSLAQLPVTKEEAVEPLRQVSPVAPQVPPSPVSAPQAFPSTPQVVRLPDIRIFDQIAAPRPLGLQKEVDRKIEQRSEEIKNSESKADAIAQIKKYLYQEEYDLCARDLAKIREQFPQNAEIQAFVENTSKRLVELQRIKKFEAQARDLMASAVAFYQEGKREEALIAVREILRVNPNHVQAREFVSFVERHQGKSRPKQPFVQKVRVCKSCGSEVDAVSQFCYHCGKRL
jgi:hypothetical protein